MLVSAQLRALVSMIGCGDRPFVPPETGVTDRASGNAVSSLKWSVIGCGGYVAATGTEASVPSSWPMPLTSTTTFCPGSIDHSFNRASMAGLPVPGTSSGSSSTSR